MRNTNYSAWGTPYAKCNCDKYSLQIMSFRQWALSLGLQSWHLEKCADDSYMKLWEQYENYANLIRRGSIS